MILSLVTSIPLAALTRWAYHMDGTLYLELAFLTFIWSVWPGNLWQYLVPFVESQKYTLPTNCRLHPENDVFREQEENVGELRPMQWQCRYCKKVFRSREYLDMHFDNRHSEKLETVRLYMSLWGVSLFVFISFVLDATWDTLLWRDIITIVVFVCNFTATTRVRAFVCEPGYSYVGNVSWLHVCVAELKYVFSRCLWSFALWLF